MAKRSNAQPAQMLLIQSTPIIVPLSGSGGLGGGIYIRRRGTIHKTAGTGNVYEPVWPNGMALC